MCLYVCECMDVHMCVWYMHVHMCECVHILIDMQDDIILLFHQLPIYKAMNNTWSPWYNKKHRKVKLRCCLSKPLVCTRCMHSVSCRTSFWSPVEKAAWPLIPPRMETDILRRWVANVLGWSVWEHESQWVCKCVVSNHATSHPVSKVPAMLLRHASHVSHWFMKIQI